LLTQLDYGNDLRAIFSYDSRDRFLTIDIKNGETSFLDLDYAYDNNSNITQLVNGWRDTTSSWHSETESYSYDGLDRLTSASCTSWSHTYSYDKVGNRTAADGVTYTINTVNEVTALSDGTSFTYDDNGNRTQKTKGPDTWAYTYDYANRLTKVEKNSETLGEYVYDGDGRRMQVTENSVATIYIYSGLDTLYEETMTGTADYIYGPTGRLAKRTVINEESNMFYYHTDSLGSTRLVTDESGNIVSAIAYHPFGKSDTEEGTEDCLFTGKEQDATGLYYYGARYYDSEVGGFLTRDPLKGERGVPQTLNRYVYCLNNPLKYVDPTGTDEEPKTAQEKVEDVFSRMQNVDSEELVEVQELMDEGKFLEALIRILELLGFEFWDNEDGTLTMKIGEDEWTVIIDPELVDPKTGQPARGLVDDEDPDNLTIYIRFTSDDKAADITLTVLHEVSHVVLGCKDTKKEHKYIYGVEYSYMVALYGAGFEFSESFWSHIVGRYERESDKRFKVQTVEICKKWVRGWRRC